MKAFHQQDPLNPMSINWVEIVEKQEEKLLTVPPPPSIPTPPPPPPPIPMDITTVSDKTAFKRRFIQKKWFIRREKDILKVFRDYRGRVKHAVLWKKHQKR